MTLYYNASHYTTWEDAKNSCLQCNATLLGFNYEWNPIQQYISNVSSDEIWIGLKKNASNLTEFPKANMDDLFKRRKCECRNIAGDFRNVSCSSKLLPSLCKKGIVDVHVRCNVFCCIGFKILYGSACKCLTVLLLT
jgi:hypothetical protein